MAYFDDGSVPKEIADRMGYEPDSQAYTWDCPERQPLNLLEQ